MASISGVARALETLRARAKTELAIEGGGSRYRILLDGPSRDLTASLLLAPLRKCMLGRDGEGTSGEFVRFPRHPEITMGRGRSWGLDVAQDDDAARFAAFYREHYSLILTTCNRRLGDHAAAEDAAAEVFRVAWQRFPEQKDPSLAWLYVVVHNIVGNEYRRSSRVQALRDRLELVVVDAVSDEDGRAVREAMALLRLEDRELLYMAYWERLSGHEISQVLRISVPAVWVRLSRARDALRAVLDQATTHWDARDG